jgi:hypothetical protein
MVELHNEPLSRGEKTPQITLIRVHVVDSPKPEGWSLGMKIRRVGVKTAASPEIISGAGLASD